jgi:hypothetical protein
MFKLIKIAFSIFILALLTLTQGCSTNSEKTTPLNITVNYYPLSLNNVTLISADCASDSFCLAVGDNFSSQKTQTSSYEITFNVSKKSDVNLEALPQQSQVITVSCIFNTQTCVLAGQDLSNNTPLVLLTKDAGKSFFKIQISKSSGVIESSSCVTINYCMLVGYLGSSSSSSPFIAVFDPQSQQVVLKAFKLVGILTSISCWALGSCLAVGSISNPGAPSTFFDVVCQSGTCQALTNLSNKKDAAVSVSCNFGTCWAAGLKYKSYNALGNVLGPPALFRSSNFGKTWQLVKTDSNQNGLLTSVSCNKTACVAIGGSGVAPKLKSWLNVITAKQSITKSINPNALLYSVSCTSYACLAVGGMITGGNLIKPLVTLISGMS